MSFTDWEIATSGTGGQGVLNTTNPVLGSGSLFLGTDGNTRTAYTATARLDAGLNHGVNKGILRSLIRFDILVDDYANCGPGVYFMASSTDIGNNASHFYWAGLNLGNWSTTGVRPIVAWFPVDDTDPLIDLQWDASGLHVLADGANDIVVAEGNVIPFQVQWESDYQAYGGIRIRVSVGTVGSTDYDNLSPAYDFVHAANPSLSATSEGIGFMVNTGGASSLDDDEGTIWDFTQFIQLA